MSDRFDPTLGPFEVFGLDRRADLDAAQLERRLLELSREHHPDHAGSDPAARAHATLRSAQVHEAYATLRDPERRAEWLLRAAGGPTAEEDKSVPEGFLEAMLDLRMEVEEARSGSDDDRSALEQRFRGEIRRVRDAVVELLGRMDGEAPPPPELLSPARALLNEIAYHKRLLTDLLEERS